MVTTHQRKTESTEKQDVTARWREIMQNESKDKQAEESDKDMKF